MRIERELMRGAGPVAVLKVLEGGKRYGYELVTAVAQHSDGILTMGQSTLYPMLYNLEAQGFIKGEWAEGASGRERKYYSLTPKGKRRLAAQTKEWRTVVRAMESLGILPHAGGEATA